ncbi:MAG: hypothetical protein NTY74_12160 [Ignavibacteriae bacterium]|nr:hypothetical protein [Ignavibacteriota bacterium]
MTEKQEEFKTEEEFIQALKEEVQKLDPDEIEKKYSVFDTSVANYNLYVENAQFIVKYRLNLEAKDDNYKELNLLTELSFELIRAIRGCSKALINHISLTNYMYKPMHLLGLEKYDYDKVASDNLSDNINEMLENIKPIFKYLNKKVKTQYKDLENKVEESEFKDKIIRRKSRDLDNFKTTDDKRTDYAEIFIKVLRGSKRMPTMKALEIASHGKISKSTWSRKMHHTEVLDKICTKLNAMIKEDSRIKNDDRIDFYNAIYEKLNDRYNLMVIPKLDIEKVREKALQIKSGYISGNSQNED